MARLRPDRLAARSLTVLKGGADGRERVEGGRKEMRLKKIVEAADAVIHAGDTVLLKGRISEAPSTARR